jgi:DNA-binding transcriptional ArsR family regulator
VILERLTGGPATIGEATKDLSISKPTVTKHVKLLEDARMVSRSVEGRQHRLRLEP